MSQGGNGRVGPSQGNVASSVGLGVRPPPQAGPHLSEGGEELGYAPGVGAEGTRVGGEEEHAAEEPIQVSASSSSIVCFVHVRFVFAHSVLADYCSRVWRCRQHGMHGLADTRSVGCPKCTFSNFMLANCQTCCLFTACLVTFWPAVYSFSQSRVQLGTAVMQHLYLCMDTLFGLW